MSDRITYPATPAIQAVAREALGFDPWGGVLANQGESWWNGLERVLPIHLSVGRHVALCELAASLGHTDSGPFWLAPNGKDGWTLMGAMGGDAEVLVWFDADDSVVCEQCDETLMYRVPALAGVTAPAAALVAIAHQRASEAADAPET